MKAISDNPHRSALAARGYTVTQIEALLSAGAYLTELALVLYIPKEWEMLVAWGEETGAPLRPAV